MGSERDVSETSIGIGLLGLGVVGGGVASALREKREHLAETVGCPLELKGALVRDASKPRSARIPDGLLTENAEDILNNPDVDIVAELMGGQEPAREYMLRAMSRGKHVVTANKEAMARSGDELLRAAREGGVQALFEAAVAGGTPIIAPITRDLAANRILSIHGIINGTTNYILTKMDGEGADFADALADAQRLGYAESDPTNDVEGIDAAYKLAILATLGFRSRVREEDVYREGITRLTARDFQYARELGFTIKLLGIATCGADGIQARVNPAFVSADSMIGKVDGALNAVEIQTDLAGKLLFHGAGAGPKPTASAVIADMVNIARNIRNRVAPPPIPEISDAVPVKPMSALRTKYYVRLTAADRAGVLARIASVFADGGISIESALQKWTDEAGERAEIVFMLHPSGESAMRQAVERLESLDVVAEVGNMIRVEEW